MIKRKLCFIAPKILTKLAISLFTAKKKGRPLKASPNQQLITALIEHINYSSSLVCPLFAQ